MEIVPLTEAHIPEGAALFGAQYRDLRRLAPCMPPDMEDPQRVMARLERILRVGSGLAALEDGRLVGYLAWVVDEGFRGTHRTAAYCPEWAHAVQPENAAAAYRRLYIEASRRWTEAGYATYALTYLVNNTALEPFLYHNGFGMIVMDAVRPIEFRAEHADAGLQVRRCTAADAGLIAALDVEHNAHYPQPPTLMQPRQVESAETVRQFLSDERNSYWVAEEGDRTAGFIRFEHGYAHASAVVRSETSVAITGAFVRPGFRGRGAAPIIMQAALAEYARKGYRACSVDFESVNPEAYHFWRRYFQTVCHSVVRCPEKYL